MNGTVNVQISSPGVGTCTEHDPDSSALYVPQHHKWFPASQQPVNKNNTKRVSALSKHHHHNLYSQCNPWRDCEYSCRYVNPRVFHSCVQPPVITIKSAMPNEIAGVVKYIELNFIRRKQDSGYLWLGKESFWSKLEGGQYGSGFLSWSECWTYGNAHFVQVLQIWIGTHAIFYMQISFIRRKDILARETSHYGRSGFPNPNSTIWFLRTTTSESEHKD